MMSDEEIEDASILLARRVSTERQVFWRSYLKYKLRLLERRPILTIPQAG